MAIGKNIFELEGKIGYKFHDIAYLERALTHSSYAYEMKSRGRILPSNERLEFLGDSVLELVISEYLFDSFSECREGILTKMRQYLVCERSLFAVAQRLGLGEYINLGRGEEQAGHRARPKVLADALEALIAAIYLDSLNREPGAARKFILAFFDEEIEKSRNMQKGDYKTMLQELVEKDGAALLEYELSSETGPDHDKSFSVVAKVNNNIVGRGSGKTKKDAEMAAAKEALSLFGVSI